MTEIVNSRLIKNLQAFYVSWEFYGGHSRPVWLGNTLFQSSDFFHDTSTGNTPFVGSGLNSGSVSVPPSEDVNTNHPGVVGIRSSTSANSGYKYRSGSIGGSDQHLLGPNDGFEVIFQPVVLTNSIFRFGYTSDQNLAGTPYSGVWFHAAGSTLTGKASTTGTPTTTGTSYTLVIDTWYRARLLLSDTAVTFYLFSEAGALLWTDSLTGGYPTAVDVGGDGLVNADITCGNTGTTQQLLVNIDYAAFWTTGLVR